MTNLEHFKKTINKMSAEEIGEIWQSEEMPWCNSLCTEETCAECVKKWANQPHEKPMPELKVGMFVKASNRFNTDLGIIINNTVADVLADADADADALAVAYSSGGYDPIENVIIEAIYSTVGFRYCDKNTCIWRRD